ncbi:MAG: metallophosphoesterase [Azoarcus sp.]|jgi:predicted MPP superfamily phosphohydrolase|nr:metallophosphoesterase [Azoarcus sp.]
MSSFPTLFSIVKGLYVVFNVVLIAWIYFSLRGPGVSRGVRIGFSLLAVALSLAYFVAREISGNTFWVKGVLFAGHFWFAFVYHALLAWVLFNVFRLFNRRFRWFVVAKEDLARWRHRSCAGITVTALVICIAGWINMQYPVVREERLSVPAGTAPLRIVALSDLHLGRLASAGFLSSVVDRIEPLSPDIVLFLGDILETDFDPSDAQAAAAVLQRLKPRLGVWGVMGNHEYLKDKDAQNKALLNQIGIRTLIDQWEVLGKEPDEKILLIGRRDRRAGRKSVQKVIENVPEADKGALKILLDHQPSDLEGAEKAGVFLQLSGHSHNGQFFPLNFVVPFFFENAYGYYRRGQTHYWVSSGAGAWGPRIRTSGRPEIMLIDLVPQPDGQAQEQPQ